MTFSLETSWVWDSWLADDGTDFHLYYLHAPRSLGDERLRHRNARIGHAISADLRTWTDLGPVLGPGGAEDFDATATWTGSVVRGPDGLWRMFYTGSRFLSRESAVNVESIGVAISSDLHHWEKAPGPLVTADPRWYEVLGDGTWREEAWRDPWVLVDSAGAWHMLLTARARRGAGDDRGVIAHAVSSDLADWEVRPPLSEPGAGFAHLEVPQLAEVDGRRILLFSCDGAALAGGRAGERGGVWAVPVADEFGPFDTASATRVVTDDLYAGHIVSDRGGSTVLLAFRNGSGEGFGTVGDPLPLHWDEGADRVAVRGTPS